MAKNSKKKKGEHSSCGAVACHPMRFVNIVVIATALQVTHSSDMLYFSGLHHS